MKARAKLPSLRRQAGLHQQNRLPLSTLQFKLQTVHSLSQMNQGSRMTRSPRQIVTEAMMLSVPLLEPQAVLLAVPEFPGRETIARKRIGNK
jgi:hypothetical protein